MKRKIVCNYLFNAICNWAGASYKNGKKKHDLSSKAYLKLFGCCIDHTGKMTDVISISTSCLCNDHCKKRINNKKMICSHCFSMNMHKFYKGLKNRLRWNSWMLSEYVFPEYALPVIKTDLNMFRFESFGDLINETQVINYFNIAKKNNSVMCALWSKNPWIIQKTIDMGYSKPANLKIIGSSYFLNDPMLKFFQKYDFIDHVFTVYEPEYAKENNIPISCGARSCATCQKCYCPGRWSSYEINELLK